MLPTISKLVYVSLDGGESYPFKARVADIAKLTLSIELPVEEGTGRLRVFPEGTLIDLMYYSEDSGQISFQSKVVMLRKEQVPLLVIEIPQKYQRIQRRDFIRVPTTVELAVKIVGKEEKNWHVVQAMDISGGGMQLIVPLSVDIADQEALEGWIILPFNNGTIDHIKFHGEVVRVFNQNNTLVNRVSVKFTNIQETMREKIVRFCYEKQVAMKKRIR